MNPRAYILVFYPLLLFFSVVLKITNFSADTEYDVSVSLRVDTMLYTGKIKHEVKKKVFDLKIPAYSGKHFLYNEISMSMDSGLSNIFAYTEEDITLFISYDDYMPKLCDQCAFNVACLAKVEQTDFEYFAQDDFRVRKPDIKFEVRKLACNDKFSM